MKFLVTTMIMAIIVTGCASHSPMGASRSIAGKETGNGGGIHYCPQRSQKIQFYDLYEGKNGRPKDPIDVYETAYATKEILVEDAIKKLKKYDVTFGTEVNEQINFIRKEGTIVEVDKKLKLISDANYLWTDPDCTYEQLANWDDEENIIYVRKDFFDAIRNQPLDEAAFELHEAIYKVLRKNLELQTSDLSRELVGILLSNRVLAKDPAQYGIIKNLIKDPSLGAEIKIIKREGSTYVLHFGDMSSLRSTDIKVKLTFIHDLTEKLNARINKLKADLPFANRRSRKKIEIELKQLEAVGFDFSYRVFGKTFNITRANPKAEVEADLALVSKYGFRSDFIECLRFKMPYNVLNDLGNVKVQLSIVKNNNVVVKNENIYPIKVSESIFFYMMEGEYEYKDFILTATKK